MAEIYRDAVGKAVTLGVAGAVVTKVEFKRHGEVLHSTTTSPAEIPYAVTHEDGEFDVVWTYTVAGESYSRTEKLRVVTPLFTAEDLAYDSALNSLSAEQVVRLESLVRRIIEAYTGQTFGYRKGWVISRGRGDNYLISPERVISVDSDALQVSSSNYTVTRTSVNYNVADVNIKVPAEEEAFFYGVTPSRNFSNGTTYKIYGEFGWASVPDDVKEAALLLAEEFSCDESVWRDRYIKSIRAADWRFDFVPGAYTGTGSLSADQLLAKYVVNRATVI